MAERDTFGQPPADLHGEALHAPIEPAQRGPRHRRSDAVGLVAGIAHAVGIEQRRTHHRLGEAVEDEGARLGYCDRAVLLAERVVVEAGQHEALLDGRAELLVEAMLRRVPHDEVAARDEKQGRHGDGACIGHDAVGRLVKTEQHIGGDGAGDERVQII